MFVVEALLTSDTRDIETGVSIHKLCDLKGGLCNITILSHSSVERRPDGFHISFKGKDGQWLAPKKLEQLPRWGICPMITPDGKYMFFVDNQWISAKFIEEFRPKALK